VIWRKSSYSSSGSNECVEVGVAPGVIGVRDSKNRAAGRLAVSRTAWAAFVRGVSVP
jgi:hypothetical protein